MEAHPSDVLVHWSEFNCDEKEITDLRKAWDLLHATPELAKATSTLMDWAVRYTENVQAEIDAGEDI